MCAQTNVNYFPTTLGGNASMGITTAPILSAPQFRIHGITDYTETTLCPISLPGGPTCNPVTWNYGKTSRFVLSNTTTGVQPTDGTVLRQSNLDFTIRNQEIGNIFLTTGSVSLNMNGAVNRVFFGGGGNSVANGAYVNISSAVDNGLFVKSINAAKYGISIQTALNATANAFQVLDNANVKNFTVTGTGNVFARKYTTTLAAIPDYVFAKDYKLMPLSELRTFLDKEKHLPNIPSATEYEKTGVDLGELNRLLLEKVEEAHLYILQLETRLKTLEEKK